MYLLKNNDFLITNCCLIVNNDLMISRLLKINK